MRTGAIFARGSCRALKWLMLSGLVVMLGSGTVFAQTVNVDTTKGGGDGIETTIRPPAGSRPEGGDIHLDVTLHALVQADVAADATTTLTLSVTSGPATLITPSPQTVTFTKHSGNGQNAEPRSVTTTFRLATQTDGGGEDDTVVLSLTPATPFDAASQPINVKLEDPQTQSYTLDRPTADRSKIIRAGDTVNLEFKSTLEVEAETTFVVTTSNPSLGAVTPLAPPAVAADAKADIDIALAVGSNASNGDMTQIVVSIAGDTTTGRPPRVVADYVARVGGGAPTAPGMPTVTATPGNGEVMLSWTEVTGATKYQYAYAAAGTATTALTWMPPAGQTARTARIDNLTNNTAYDFYARAGDATGYGPASAKMTAIPTATGTPGTGNAVVATWTASYMPGDDMIKVTLSGTGVGNLYAEGNAGTFTLTNASGVSVRSTNLPGTRDRAAGMTFMLYLSGDLMSTPSGAGRLMLQYAWNANNGIVSHAGPRTSHTQDKYIMGEGPFALTEVDIPPMLPRQSNWNVTLGEAITVELDEATGGNGTLSYHMTSQSDLPPGLRFYPGSATEPPEISGTPTRLGGPYTVYYEVRDSNDNLLPAEVDSSVHTENIQPFDITVVRDTTIDRGDGMYGRVTSTKLIDASGNEIDTKTIGGVERYHVGEGNTGVRLEVTVEWTVRELRAIYGSATTLSDPNADLRVWILSDSSLTTDWASMIDAEQDVHFPSPNVSPEGNVWDNVQVKYPSKPRASEPDAARKSSTGTLRVYFLPDDFEAENEVFYIEVYSSNDVDVDSSHSGGRPGSYTSTRITIIEDDDPQGVVIKKAASNKSVTVDGKERIMENAGTASFTVTAVPERYDLPLEVRLDLVTFETGTVVRGDKYSLSDASPTLNPYGTGGTAANMATVTMEFPNNDGDRIDNHYTLEATAIDYSLTSGVDTTIKKDPAEHHITLVDVHKLPRLTVTPATDTVEEDGETTLTLMIDREIKEPGLAVQKATSEPVTVMLTAGAGSTAGNRDYDLPAMVSFPKKPASGTTQTMEVTIEAMTDEMLDAGEMLVVDAEVDGTVAANGRNTDMDKYAGVSTVTITDATAKLVYAKTAAELAAAIKAAGLDAALTSGDAIPIMGSALFGAAEGATVIYSAMSSDATVATSSVSGGEIMVMAVGKGDAMITVEASASMGSGVTVNKQTEPDRASIEIPVSVALAPLSITLEGPDAGMNLVEGMEYTITAMANRAVEMDTMVELIQTDGTSSPADYEVEPITIKMGESMGTTKLMVAEDGMMENEGNMTEMLTLEGRVGAMKTTNSLMFYLWDAAVPALPIIAQFLLAALMAVGGYRRYRRR